MSAAAHGDPTTLEGQRVRVHFNLITRRWSIVALSGDRRGRVIAVVDDITLAGGVQFKVSIAGWQRSRRIGRRTVHAWCVGRVQAINTAPQLGGLRCVTYNPARGPAFHLRPGGVPVTDAARVVFAKTTPTDRHGYAWIEPTDEPA